MKLTCSSCSGSQNQWNITWKSFPALKNCTQNAWKTKLRCRENIWRNSWKFNLKKIPKNFRLQSGQNKIECYRIKLYFVLCSRLKIVEQEVVWSQSFTGLENRMLTLRLCFHIRCISVSMLMPSGRQPVKAVFLHYHATIVSVVHPVSSLISNRGSFPGDAVDCFLIPSSFKIMGAWNVTATHAI